MEHGFSRIDWRCPEGRSGSGDEAVAAALFANAEGSDPRLSAGSASSAFYWPNSDPYHPCSIGQIRSAFIRGIRVIRVLFPFYSRSIPVLFLY